MAEAFQIQETASAGAAVFRIHGHLDAKSAPELLARGKGVRKQGQGLVLNLSQVTFIASSGVGSILALAEEFTQNQLAFRLAEVPSAVMSVFQLLNLDNFLEIDDSEEEAVSRLEAA